MSDHKSALDFFLTFLFPYRRILIFILFSKLLKIGMDHGKKIENALHLKNKE